MDKTHPEEEVCLEVRPTHASCIAVIACKLIGSVSLHHGSMPRTPPPHTALPRYHAHQRQVDYRWAGDANIFLAIELPAGGSATRMVPKVSNLAVRCAVVALSSVEEVVLEPYSGSACMAAQRCSNCSTVGYWVPTGAGRTGCARLHPSPCLPLLRQQRHAAHHPQAAAARDPGLWRRGGQPAQAAHRALQPQLWQVHGRRLLGGRHQGAYADIQTVVDAGCGCRVGEKTSSAVQHLVMQLAARARACVRPCCQRAIGCQRCAEWRARTLARTDAQAWLDPFLRETVSGMMLWPKRMVVPILPEEVTGPLDDLYLRRRGALQVDVVEARALPRMDTVGTSARGATGRRAGWGLLAAARAGASAARRLCRLQFP